MPHRMKHMNTFSEIWIGGRSYGIESLHSLIHFSFLLFFDCNRVWIPNVFTNTQRPRHSKRFYEFELNQLASIRKWQACSSKWKKIRSICCEIETVDQIHVERSGGEKQPNPVESETIKTMRKWWNQARSNGVIVCSHIVTIITPNHNNNNNTEKDMHVAYTAAVHRIEIWVPAPV